MKHHRGVLPEEGDLGDFAPKGEPQKLNEGSGAGPGASEPSGDAFYNDSVPGGALEQFAGIGRAGKSSSLAVGSSEGGQKVSVPLEGVATSLTNRKV
ncbi:MAG: hypothetical protein Q8S13_04495 [Dehalococcoidia bacterium]|nr:hypothetical protein [Dehalococcoidia bacterium]